MLYLGIDPGLSGAIAVLDEAGEPFGLGVFDVPVLTVTRSSGKKRRVLDLEAMRALLVGLQPAGLRATLEQVGAMPGQGVASMFSFGEGFGAWKGLLVGLQVPHVLVHPQRWQKAMLDGVPKGADAALMVARRRWPGADLARKKDDGRADALLLAEWGRTRGWAQVPAAGGIPRG